jgi:hypothetical protein
MGALMIARHTLHLLKGNSQENDEMKTELFRAAGS